MIAVHPRYKINERASRIAGLAMERQRCQTDGLDSACRKCTAGVPQYMASKYVTKRSKRGKYGVPLTVYFRIELNARLLQVQIRARPGG
jgi:hypothetical protein